MYPPPLACTPLCPQNEAFSLADPPDFYLTGHKKQLTAPCSIASTKKAGAKYGFGRAKTSHTAIQTPDFLLPYCWSLQPPYAILILLF